MLRLAQGVVVTRNRAEREECRVWAILRVEAVWAMGFAARLGSGFFCLSSSGCDLDKVDDAMEVSALSSIFGPGSAMDTRLDIRRTFGGRFTDRRAEWLVLRAGGRGRSRGGCESEDCGGGCWRRGLLTSAILSGVVCSESIVVTVTAFRFQ